MNGGHVCRGRTTVRFVKLVVQVKLLPTPGQASALKATLRACNRAATHASTVAFAQNLKDRNGLQKEAYADLKATFGLSAQPVVRAVKKVVDAHAALKASLQAGNLGPSTSKRYRKAVSTPIAFRPEAPQPSTTAACPGSTTHALSPSGRWTGGRRASGSPVPRTSSRRSCSTARARATSSIAAASGS